MKSVKNGENTVFKAGNPGRKKGNRNKFTRLAKDNINAVYEGLGSIEGHIQFLKYHVRSMADFYSNVYPRLLPMDVNTEHSGTTKVAMTIRVVQVKDQEGNGNSGK
ncbi:MAG TPA: hypothetical protein DIW61_16595 [Candidatus Aminicenantes bacterium]|nr:hypothetical protein [Candidatus Aminicenantes bacterium]